MLKGMDSKKLKKLTFNEVADECLKTYSKGRVKRGSIIAREVQANLLKKFFYNKLIIKITHRIYQNFLNEHDDLGYARNTMLGVNNTANMIFKYALRNKFITENPVIDAVVPHKNLTVEEIENKDLLIEDKYLDRTELTDFLKTVAEKGRIQEKELFYLLTFSGLRPGELCALKWTDIDFENNQIRISKTLLGSNRRAYILGTPKTKKSVRIVPVDSDVIAMLEIHKENQSERQIEELRYYPDYHNADFVFKNAEGYSYTAHSVRNRMASLIKKTNIT